MPACKTPEFRPLWWKANCASFSIRATFKLGRLSLSSRAVAHPTNRFPWNKLKTCQKNHNVFKALKTRDKTEFGNNEYVLYIRSPTHRQNLVENLINEFFNFAVKFYVNFMKFFGEFSSSFREILPTIPPPTTVTSKLSFNCWLANKSRWLSCISLINQSLYKTCEEIIWRKTSMLDGDHIRTKATMSI